MAEKCRNIVRAMSKYAFSGLMAVAAVYAAALLLLWVCGIRPYIVMSGSMEPAIRTGSLCFVDTRASFESVEPGDVIAFESVGGMVTHRAVGISDGEIETKGDANDIIDSFTVKQENFRGRTLFSVPGLGYIHYGMSSGLGKIGCLSVILGLAIVEITEKATE